MRSRDIDNGGLRTINGNVNADGSISSGVGFTVTKTGAGAYVVRFQGVRFIRGGPVVLFTTYGYQYSNVTQPNQINVWTLTTAAVYTDSTFTFAVQVMPV
jgi:lipocalin